MPSRCGGIGELAQLLAQLMWSPFPLYLREGHLQLGSETSHAHMSATPRNAFGQNHAATFLHQ